MQSDKQCRGWGENGGKSFLFLLPRRSVPSLVLGRGTAAQVAAVLGTLNQIIRTQRT